MATKLAVRKSAANGLSFKSAPVTLRVGNSNDIQTFYVNGDTLTRHSDFFFAALSHEWKEASQRTVDLPEEDADLVEIFLRFIHTGAIHSQVDTDVDTEDKAPEWTRLARCWLLGDRLQAPSFQDAALDAIVSKMDVSRTIPITLHEIVYPQTAGPNALRRLLVDIAVYKWPEQRFKSMKHDSSCSEFYLDLAVASRITREATRDGRPPFYRFDCSYHLHGTAKPCYKTMF